MEGFYYIPELSPIEEERSESGSGSNKKSIKDEMEDD
jgi:hypothetical protein